MADLKAYFDDSGDDDNADHRHNAFVLAGFVGSEESWITFEMLWKQALEKHDVPYFHMKHLAHFAGPYKKWKGNEAARVAFFQDAVDAVAQAKLEGIGSLIRLNDLRKFNLERGLKIDAVTLAIYANCVELHEKYGRRAIDAIIDRVNQAPSKIASAKKYAETDTYYPGCSDSITISALKGDQTYRNVLPMQAADFAAWELRKDNETNTEFFADVLPTLHRQEMLPNYVMWQVKKFGKATWPPTRRKSLDALSRASHFEGGVWDYAMFVAADKARNGVWPS